MMAFPLTWSPFHRFSLLERMLEKVSPSQEPSSFHFCHSTAQQVSQQEPSATVQLGRAREGWKLMSAGSR